MKNFSIFAQPLRILFLFILCITFFNIGAHASITNLDDPDVPIDGGLSILLAAGVGYGIKELRKNRSKNPFRK